MGNKPKILIFIDWYKPGFKAGGPIRSISNLVDYLSEKLDFYIVTRNTDYLDTKPYESINPDQWNTIDSSKVYYFSKNNLSYKNIKQLVSEINPNYIYCNSLYSLYFSLTPIYIAKKEKIKSVLAVRGMLSQGSLGVKSGKKKIFLALTKAFNLFNKSIFHATNSIEKKDIETVYGKNKNIIIAQNLPEKNQTEFQQKEKEVESIKLTSIGRIAPEKNTLYALEVLKNVKYNVTFDIYGPIYSDEYWNKCKTTINLLPSNIVVNYKGILEHHKIEQALKNYHVLFLPSTGENFGHVIIEAMINSCIPLISNKTPWVNLETKQIGYDIPLEKQALFSETIDILALMDEKTLNKSTKNAHQFAADIINDKKLIEDYYKLFNLTNLDG